MRNDNQLVAKLKGLIGRSVVHQGKTCTVLELLESEPALVLISDTHRSSLQDNQYGNPGRRVPETFTIPLYDEEDSSQIHPKLLRLGLISTD